MAVDMARFGDGGQAKVILLHLVPPGARNGDLVRANQVFQDSLAGINYENIERRIAYSHNIVEGILREASGDEQSGETDLIIIGATQEPLLRQIRVGNISEQIAREAHVTVIVVKRRSGLFHSFLRQTVLTPASLPTSSGDIDIETSS
jgi:hypothetical protein